MIQHIILEKGHCLIRNCALIMTFFIKRKMQIWDKKFCPKNIKISYQLVFEMENGTENILYQKLVLQQNWDQNFAFMIEIFLKKILNCVKNFNLKTNFSLFYYRNFCLKSRK